MTLFDRIELLARATGHDVALGACLKSTGVSWEAIARLTWKGDAPVTGEGDTPEDAVESLRIHLRTWAALDAKKARESEAAAEHRLNLISEAGQ